METLTKTEAKKIIERYEEIPEKERILADHIRAAAAGSFGAEFHVVEETGKGQNGWAVVSSNANISNKRSIYSRHESLAKAFAACKGADCIVIAADNLGDDSKWVWGDTRHLMISSDGWTTVVPA